MSEKIPADIKRSAEQAANEVVGLLDEFGAAMPHVRSIIARYLLAERRRCAEAYMHWARKMMEEVEGKDGRPENCRFRLQDEGKPYPRSGCAGCGRTILTGLGSICHLANKDEKE